MNAQYIKKLNIEELINISADFINTDLDISDKSKLIKVFTFIKDRINTLSDITALLIPFYENINIVNQDILDNINDKISQDIIKYWSFIQSNFLLLNIGIRAYY